MNIFPAPLGRGGSRPIRLAHAANYVCASRIQIRELIDAGRLRVLRLGTADFVESADLDALLAAGVFSPPSRS